LPVRLLLLLLLLVLLEQPDTVVVRGYSRVIPGRPGAGDRGGASVGRRPLPLLVVVVVVLLLLVLVVVLAVVRRRFVEMAVVIVDVVGVAVAGVNAEMAERRLRRGHVVRHRLPAGHRAGPVARAPRFRERAERHVRGPGARVGRHASLGAGSALVPDHDRVHGLQVRVTGPASLFVGGRRGGRR